MVGLGTCPLYRVSDACKSEGDLYRWFIHVVFAQAGLPNTSFKLPLCGPPSIHPYLEILTFLLRATSCQMPANLRVICTGGLYMYMYVVFAQAGLPNTSFKLPLRGPPSIHPYLEILTFLLQATSCPFNFTTTFSNSLDLFFLFSRIICAFASFNFSPFSFYTLCNSCKIYTRIVWH